MKLQSLAVIFAIIILPISLILGIYVDNQVETLRLQISYDSKLDNATYDALKSFQLNTINNSGSDLSESKISDIEASVNSFYNSIASNFNMPGYNRDILKEYVPALVYTMYDGYYIYSEYENTITKEDYLPESEASGDVKASTYQNGEYLSGLKSYVYYSCRYKPTTGGDFVITYSLDNYIRIKGKDASGNVIDLSGYLIDNITDETEDSIKYRNIEINSEDNMKEFLEDGEYEYKKINGVKYYKNGDKCFSVFNGERYLSDNKFENNERNYSAVKYYSEAKKFREELRRLGLESLSTDDAVEIKENGSITKIAADNDWRKILYI